MLRSSKVLSHWHIGIAMPSGKKRGVGIKREIERGRSRSRSRSRAVQQKKIDKKKNQSLFNALSPTNIGRSLSRSRSRSRSRSVGRRGLFALAPHCDGNASKSIDKKVIPRFRSRSRSRGNTTIGEVNRSAYFGTSFLSCNFAGWWCGG